MSHHDLNKRLKKEETESTLQHLIDLKLQSFQGFDKDLRMLFSI